jgi:hypothetical protein
MKKLQITCLIFLGSFQMLCAQTFEWAKQFGGSLTAEGYSMAVDGNGNVYTTGIFQGTIDFDPGAGTFNLTTAGDFDVYVSKLDASGNFAWAVNFGDANNDIGVSIGVDDAGNVYTTGHFLGTIDFDPGPGVFNLSAGGTKDVFISKLDNSGNFIWAKRFEANSQAIVMSIAVDAAGNSYTAGYFRDLVDFDPGVGTSYLSSSPALNDVFVCKLDASGNLVWVRNMGGNDDCIAQGITIDAVGNVYTTGYFEGTMDFDPGSGTVILTTAGNADAFVSKLNADGNYVWSKQLGGTAMDRGFSVAVDNSGNVHTTGFFSGTGDFDPGTGSYPLVPSGNPDTYISKLDASGNFVWAKTFESVVAVIGRSIALDDKGSVYTTGDFAGQVDFDPGTGTFNLTTPGDYDAFISKLDASGNFTWAVSFEGSGAEVGRAVALDGFGNVHTTGSFNGTADFNPGTGTGETFYLTSGGTDAFVHKMGICNVNTTVSLALGTLTAETGYNYQWLNCETGYSVIAGATSQSFTPSTSGNYAVELTADGCVDTSECFNVSVVGITQNTTNSFAIFPNPAHDKLTITGLSGEQTLMLVNTLGQVLILQPITDNEYTLDVSRLPAGVYTLRISTGSAIESRKVIVEPPKL